MTKKVLIATIIAGLVWTMGCTKPSPEPWPRGDGYQIVVNYDLSLKEAFEAGKFEYLHPKVSSFTYPTLKTGSVNEEIFLMNVKPQEENVRPNAVLIELDKRGFRPADLRELLAFGAQHPEVHLDLPLLELGSVAGDEKGGVGMIYLNTDHVMWSLWSNPRDIPLYDDLSKGGPRNPFQFAAIRK